MTRAVEARLAQWRTLRRASAWLLAAAPLISSGCSSGGHTARLEVELAPEPIVASGATCSIDTTVPRSLPSTLRCLSVSACRRTALGCEPIGLVRTSSAHDTTYEELRFPFRPGDASRSFELDGRFGDGPVELTLVVYDESGEPIVWGTNPQARPASDRVRIRLASDRAWSCAGPDVTGTQQALARAMHSATALPNGDVLIFGGVTGQAIALDASAGAVLQGEVEVYLAGEQRFQRVTGDRFERVGFSASLLQACPAGVSNGADSLCIRVLGGLTANGGQDVLRFSAEQNNFLGSPIVAGANAVLATPAALLVYSPSRRAIRVVDEELAMLSGSAFGAWSTPSTDGPSLFVPHVTEVGTAATFMPALTSSGTLLDASGGVVATNVPLGTQRFFSTVTSLSASAARFLVWGGNIVLSGSASVLLEQAGRRVDALGASTAIAAGDVTMGQPPPPVAFHSATSLGEGGVLIAGGLPVAVRETASLSILTTPPAAPLVLLRETSPSSAAFSGIAVAGAEAYESTILHGAVTVGTAEQALLVGGARTLFDRTRRRYLQFFDTDRVVRVTRAATGANAQILPSLVEARFAHSTTVLPGGRVLVVGGFRRAATTTGAGALRALESAEVLSLERPAAHVLPSECMDVATSAAGG